MLFILGFFNVRAQDTSQRAYKVYAPDFTLEDTNHIKWNLASLKGKVVVLNFWFTLCKPCIREIPELNEIKALYNPNSVVFLALSFDDKYKIESFLKQHEFKFQILPNSRGVNRLYRVDLYPTTIIIDREGFIRKRIPASNSIRNILATEIDKAFFREMKD